MSYLLATSQVGYLTNREKDDFLYLDDDGDDYNFKYISGNEFKYIMKDVRRQRCRDEEERAWYEFVKQQELSDQSDRYDKEDRELRRLEEDTIPEYKIQSRTKDNGINHKWIHSVKEHREQNSAKRLIRTKSNDTIIIDVERPLQEENLSHMKSVRSKQSSDLRRTSSDYMILQSKHSKRSHVSCEFDYGSTPDLSIQYESDKEDICLHPDLMATHKILIMQKKISELLDEISSSLDKIQVPDGAIDLKRRQKRDEEFCIRLSRNYLYDLTRCVNDIQKHIRAISLSAKIKSGRRGITFHMQIIEQKLIAAHQLLYQALTAYCKHIPCSIPQGYTTKVKDLLKIVTDLKDICDHIQLTTSYFGSGDTCTPPLEREIQSKCNIILSKLKLSSATVSQIDVHNTVTNTVIPMNIHQPKKHCKQKNLETRLSMYNMETKAHKNNLKKKSSKHHRIQDKKHNACNNKSTHNENFSLPQHLQCSPVMNTSSKEIVKENDIKYSTCPKEDNIQTIMDEVSIDSDNDINSEIVQPQRSNGLIVPKKAKPIKGSPDKLQDVKYSKSQEKHKKSSSLNLYNDLPKKKNSSATSDEILFEFLKKYGSLEDSNNKGIADIDCISHVPSKNSTIKSKKETTKEKKNMHLICFSSFDKAFNEYTSCDALNNYPKKMHKDKKTKSTVQKNDIIQLHISKEIESKLLRYKSGCCNLSKRSPMYYNNTRNKPWAIVAWVSDQLVDDLINEISQEFEMKDVIHKMFQLEFQE